MALPFDHTCDPVWDAKKLIARIRLGEQGCWIWQGQYVGEYGRTGYRGKTVLAHRASFLIFCGPIPQGHSVDHLCRNKACVNPNHLDAVPQSINVRRGNGPALTRQRSRKKQCKHGHELSPENVYEYSIRGYTTWHCRACKRVACARSRQIRKDRNQCPL